MQYRIESCCSTATLADYVSLFRDSYGGDAKLTEEYLRWEYFENPDGRVIGFDAFLGADLAAHYAIIPREWSDGRGRHLGALSVNTATHPNHQGKGLFVRLAAATYERAASLGVKFVVGVANANSIPGFTKKLGFRVLGQVRLHLLMGPPSRPPEESLGVRRDSEWLRWRLRNPSRKYQAVSYGRAGFGLRTWVNRVPFCVARLDEDPRLMPDLQRVVGTGRRWLPSLEPHFGPVPPSGVTLPVRAQPSPWHVIWLSLDSVVDCDLAESLCLNGLSMDTF